MFKTTVTLKNGRVLNLECESAQEIVDVMLGYEKGEMDDDLTDVPSFDPPTENIIEPEVTSHSERVSDVIPGTNLNESDVLCAAKEIIATEGRYGTLATIAADLVKKTGGKLLLKRAVALVYPLKQYLFESKNRKTKLPLAIIKVLKTHGLKPGMYAVRNTSKNGNPGKEWSQRDILAIAHIVKNNLDLKVGVSTLVEKYVKNHADERSRTKATVYSFTCNLKHYLSGGSGEMRIPHKTKELLDANGIFPKTPTSATHAPAGIVRRLVVTEA